MRNKKNVVDGFTNDLMYQFAAIVYEQMYGTTVGGNRNTLRDYNTGRNGHTIRLIQKIAHEKKLAALKAAVSKTEEYANFINERTTKRNEAYLERERNNARKRAGEVIIKRNKTE